MAPYTGNGKMNGTKQKEYQERKKEEKKNRVKYLRRKVKLGTATKEDKKELENLDKE